jgi:hypothetical protein
MKSHAVSCAYKFAAADGGLLKPLWDATSQASLIAAGRPVADDIVVRILKRVLGTKEAGSKGGFILDGFPRTLQQVRRSLHPAVDYGGGA